MQKCNEYERGITSIRNKLSHKTVHPDAARSFTAIKTCARHDSIPHSSGQQPITLSVRATSSLQWPISTLCRDFARDQTVLLLKSCPKSRGSQQRLHCTWHVADYEHWCTSWHERGNKTVGLVANSGSVLLDLLFYVGEELSPGCIITGVILNPVLLGNRAITAVTLYPMCSNRS